MSNFILSYASSLNKEVGELAFNNGIQKCADSGRVPYGYIEAVNKAHSMALSFKPAEFIAQVNMLSLESIKDARGKGGFVGGCLFQIAEALFNSVALKNPPQIHPIPECFNAEKLLAKKQASADKAKANRDAKKEKEKEEKANALNEELAKEESSADNVQTIDHYALLETVVNAIYSSKFDLHELQRIFKASKCTIEKIEMIEKEDQEKVAALSNPWLVALAPAAAAAAVAPAAVAPAAAAPAAADTAPAAPAAADTAPVAPAAADTAPVAKAAKKAPKKAKA